MSRGSKDKMRRFEQRLREEGAEGFADGPRPWEHWDESGHQANNRIWEGSARRIHPRRRKTRSLGYRLLSTLTYLSLATLLVGIGGVYFSHTQAQRLAQGGVQPLPSPPERSAMSVDSEAVISASTSQLHDLNKLSAPAAGSGTTPDRTLAAIETAPAAIDEAIPVADEPARVTETIETAALAAESTPPTIDDNIDSVSIETIVTKKSVTTTVYTRHPQEQEAEMVAAIETTPPPFAHEVVDVAQQALEDEPATVHISNDETLSAAPSTIPPPVLPAVVADDVAAEAADNPVTTAADEYQYEEPADYPATGTDEANEPAAWAQPISVATAPGATDEPLAPEQNITPAAHTAGATEMAALEANTMADTPTPLESSVSAEQRSALSDNQPTEQAEDATVAAMAEADSATLAPAVSEELSNTRVAMHTPVAKTGDWVINLASYTWKSTADRKQALFQQQGVDTEIFAVTINDKPMYRIRVTGFENSREAKAGIPAIEETLNLQGAWISRR